jgi:hypothetical protein
MSQEKIKLKINTPLAKFNIGDIVEVSAADGYWARRIQDAKIDNCVSIITEVSETEVSENIKGEKKNADNINAESVRKQNPRR